MPPVPMISSTVRMSDDLKARAEAFARELGISFNALMVIALNDYLSLRSTPSPKTDPTGGGGKTSPVSNPKRKKRKK